jgi:hypothetical protein
VVKRARFFFACALGACGAGGVALACTAGDEITYSTQGTQPGDGGKDVDISDRVVHPSDVVEPDIQQPVIAPGSHASCTGTDGSADEDGGCDIATGAGCCFTSGNTDGVCLQQAEVFLDPPVNPNPQCRDPNQMFLICTSDMPDSPCCWGRGPNGALFTRYAADCGTMARACDPDAIDSDGGKILCEDHSACQTTSCNGKPVGYCMGDPPCQ